MGQFILGLIAPMFLIIMLAVGGLYPAIDSTAGERENSTWETLMTVASDRSNILISKYLSVATLSFAAGMLNLAAMTLSMKAVLTPLLGEDVSGLTMSIPLTSVPVIIVGAAMMALFIAAGMMILASFARTFKEGQSMIGPFYIRMILPLMFLQVPDIEFTPRLAAIPVVNVALMFREAIAGVYQWHLIGITLAVEPVTSHVSGLIDRFGITEYANARVEKLSSGMKQKVSIARTLVHDPPVLIFDEPTVGLDVLNALEVAAAIKKLRDEAKTILFSTHIMSEAEKLCDWIAIIHNGRILACDTLEGLRSVAGEHYLEDIFVKYVKGQQH